MFSLRSYVTFAVAACFALPAFTQTNFQYQAYPAPNGGVTFVTHNGRAADFNGDGLADLLQMAVQDCSSGSCQDGYYLYLSLNNGSGALNPARKLNVWGSQQPVYDLLWYVTYGDFNGDGKLDIAVLHASGLMSILYGNGDGTFAAPVLTTLPSATYSSLVEADFDANGTQDLAALTQSGQLLLLFNDGKGNFTQQTVALDTPSATYTTENLTVGDFNGDGRPDLAWAEEANNLRDDTSPIVAALNTANGVFSTKQQVGTIGTNGFPQISSADLDLDGKSDLILWNSDIDGCCTGPQTLEYSNGDGSFTSKPLASLPNISDVEVADINGDSNPDVLIASPTGVEVFTANPNRTFTDQGAYTGLPGGAAQLAFGFFDGSNAVGFASPNGGGMGTMASPNDGLFLVKNDNTQGNCPYPTTVGVTFCSAMNDGNTVQAHGTARAQTQPIREIQLWVNGQEMYRVRSDEFNAILNGVTQGTQVTAIAVEENGTTHSTTITPGIPNPCPAPGSPGVNFCTPTQGETFDNGVSVQVTASGTGASGTVNHLELWIDGSKYGDYNGSFMQTDLALNDGPHALTVIEVDSNWNYIKSDTRNITVTSVYGCGQPAAPGVNVCSPTQGATVSSPVAVIAAGMGASGTVNHLELWIDGKKIGDYNGATMDASVPLAAGSHAITVIEVDSRGAYVKSNTVNVTVTSAGGCQAPSTPGVNVCSPAQGATVNSPVTVIAAGEGTGGHPSDHMELWIDGSKIGDYKGAQLNTSVPLAPGSHAITVIEDSSPSGNPVDSNTINITVSGSSGPCAAPGSPGVNLCSPTQGESTGSPVAVTAAGTGASGQVNHLELWIDGSKIGDYSGATMNTSVPLAAGSHGVTVIEVDSQWNYVKSNTANITVR